MEYVAPTPDQSLYEIRERAKVSTRLVPEVKATHPDDNGSQVRKEVYVNDL